MEYTTLENLKEFLWITDTTFDIVLPKIIKRCTAQFDKYLWRNLGVSTYTSYVPTDADDLIIVDYAPITEITQLKDTNTSWNTLTYERIDANIIYLENEHTWTIFIEYNSWYGSLDDIPDVEQACLEVCNDIWNWTPASWNDATVKSKKIETLSKTYFTKSEMDWWNWMDWRETLDNYKIFNPYLI